MAEGKPSVTVIGAGIIGVSCALWLQKKGFGVTLVDGNEPGSVTSSGNACTIADYGCLPVNDPALIRQLPALILRRKSPLSIDLWYALTHLPWMLSFLQHCRQRQVDKTIAALASILKNTHAGLDPLIATTATGDLFRANGCMYVYESVAEFEKAEASHRVRAEHGAEFTELGQDEIIDLEPNLNHRFKKGIIFTNTRQTLNPQTMVTRFFQHFMAAGGNFVSDHAAGIVRTADGSRIHLHNKPPLPADRVVISCGAFSRQIKGCGTEKLPLDTERGYHIQYAGLQDMLSRPVTWIESGFYATPMNEGLRFAGTVEIAGLSPKKNQRILDYMAGKSRQMLNLPDRPTSDWVGFRPTLPDSLPVIGPSTDSPDIWYAFGHQHLGLTLAGITGKLIAEMVAGESLCMDIGPFSPSRFD